jgi:hypothetical protein
MSETLKLMRFYFWMLGLFTLGRWGLSLGGAKYADTHHGSLRAATLAENAS